MIVVTELRLPKVGGYQQLVGSVVLELGERVTSTTGQGRAFALAADFQIVERPAGSDGNQPATGGLDSTFRRAVAAPAAPSAAFWCSPYRGPDGARAWQLFKQAARLVCFDP